MDWKECKVKIKQYITDIEEENENLAEQNRMLTERIKELEKQKLKGKWRVERNPNAGVCLKEVYVCSNCNTAVGCQYFVRRSFCPNCGADMREVEE